MKLIRLKMKNFRQYTNSEILFPQSGLIGILGKNGAGKSTLFNAIGWCLYGKIKNVTSSMIKNQSAGKKEACYVEMDFLFEGHHYRVRRDLISSKCFAQVDGTMKAVGVTSLNSFIEDDLFKMDHRAFTVCYYAEQDDFDALVKLNPGPRVQTLSKLLRIETIDHAAEQVRKDFRNLELQVKEKRKLLQDGDSLDFQKYTFESELTKLLQEEKEMEQDRLSLLETYKELLMEKEKGDRSFQIFQQLSSDKKNLETRIDAMVNHALSSSKKELAELLSFQAEYDELQSKKDQYQVLKKEKETLQHAKTVFAEKTRLENEMTAIRQQVEHYHEKYKSLRIQLVAYKELDEQILSLEKDGQHQQEQGMLLRDQYQEVTFAIKTMVEKIQELYNLKHTFDELGEDSLCPTCERPLGEHYEEKTIHIMSEGKALSAKVKQQEEEKTKLSSGMQQIKAKLEQINTLLSTKRTEQMEKSKLEEGLRLLETEVSIRKDSFQKAKAAYEKVQSAHFEPEQYEQTLLQLEAAEKHHERLLFIEASLVKVAPLSSSIEALEKEIAVLTAEAKNMELSLAELDFNERIFSSLLEKITSLQQQIQAKEVMKTKIDGEKKLIANQLQAIKEKLTQQSELEKEIKKVEQHMVLLAKLDEAYKAYKTDKLNKLAPAMSDIMSHLMDELTDGKYDRIELDDKYNISIYRNGVANTLDFYSGGEKKLAALCQRLAISNLLSFQNGQSSFEMLSMDEVFGAMDDERQDAIIDMLRNLNEMYSQILIVTHSPNVKNMFDYTLEISQQADLSSHAAWLEQWDDKEVSDLVSSYEEAHLE